MSRLKLRMGTLALSAGLLLAGCNGEDEPTETSPIEEETTETDDTQPIEEQPDEETDEEATEDTDDMDDTEITDDTDITDDTNINDDINQMETPGIQGIELPVTLNSAIDIFYETFGSEEISIESIQFEEDDGRYVYSFDGWDGEYEYELEVDAETSETIEEDQEEDTDTEDELNLENIINPIEAMDAAIEASGSGYVEEWELEVEDGQTIYDVDIEDGDDQQIDAVSGEAL